MGMAMLVRPCVARGLRKTGDVTKDDDVVLRHRPDMGALGTAVEVHQRIAAHIQQLRSRRFAGGADDTGLEHWHEPTQHTAAAMRKILGRSLHLDGLQQCALPRPTGKVLVF